MQEFIYIAKNKAENAKLKLSLFQNNMKRNLNTKEILVNCNYSYNYFETSNNSNFHMSIVILSYSERQKAQ